MDKYDKIDFGAGQNTNTGDTLYDAFTKVNNNFDDIENDINDVDDNKADKITLDSEVLRIDNSIIDLTNDVDDKLALKADKLTTYNKTEVDNLIAGGGGDLSNYYTITEIDNQLNLKADKLTTYNKTEVDNLISNVEVDLTDYATTNYVNDAISNIDFPETDLTNYYTKIETYNKTEVDDLVAGGGSDLSNYYTITEIDNQLTSYSQLTYVDNQLNLKADKTETYTKVEVDNLIDNVEVDLTGYATEDYVDSSISNIDFPETDLTNYYNKTEVNGLLINKVDNTQLADYATINYVNDTIDNIDIPTTDLSNYYNKTETNNLLVNKVDNSQLANYATITQLDTKANQSTTYTKVEVDSLISNVDVDLTGYATENYVDSAISNIDFPETDLSNYYTKVETYNKTEVDDLVANSGSETDLSNYYTKTEVDNKVIFGEGATATGTNGVAIGEGATGTYGVAVGQYAIGSNGVAIGQSASNGSNGVAIGSSAKAGPNGVAVGNLSKGKNRGVAVGDHANGHNDGVAVGEYASGQRGVAVGRYSTNYAFAGIAIGQFNDPILTLQQTSFNAEHPLFIIGNGTSTSDRKNAFVMLQNGKSEFTNVVSYKEDYSADFTDNSLVNKKFVDTQLNLKADKSTTYSKVEVDGLIDNIDVDLTDYATENYVNNAIDNIVFPETDLSEYATINYVDDAINNIDFTETDLSNYYTKVETYNKTEVDTKVVFGEGASGTGGVAIGNNSNGSNGVAIGNNSNGSNGGIAFGNNSNGSNGGIAFGNFAHVSNSGHAFGNNARALGTLSVAVGQSTETYAYGGIAIGRFNDPILTSAQTSFNAEHPLFIIGNGLSTISRSNAFVMWQNGKSQFTNIASYKSDFSGDFTDNSLVNKKYVDDLVADSIGGGSDLTDYHSITGSTTATTAWNNAIILTNSINPATITIPANIGNMNFIIRNRNNTVTLVVSNGTFDSTSTGQTITTGRMTSVIVHDGVVITTGSI